MKAGTKIRPSARMVAFSRALLRLLGVVQIVVVQV
jgi:hypothetical protein